MNIFSINKAMLQNYMLMHIDEPVIDFDAEVMTGEINNIIKVYDIKKVPISFNKISYENYYNTRCTRFR